MPFDRVVSAAPRQRRVPPPSPFGSWYCDDRLTSSSRDCFERLIGLAQSIIQIQSARLSYRVRTEKHLLDCQLPDLGVQLPDLRLVLLDELVLLIIGEHVWDRLEQLSLLGAQLAGV